MLDYWEILNEATLQDLLKKQNSEILKLFPKYYDRVSALKLKGGAHMVDMDEHGWYFKVKSFSEKLVNEYDVTILFNGVMDVLEYAAKDSETWTKNNTIDIRKIAYDVMRNVDIQIKCSCPADLYWGKQFIRTKHSLGAMVPPGETRPPKVRNPHEWGAVCKHEGLVLNLLPMYAGTFSKWLKEYWLQHIQDLERKLRRSAYKQSDKISDDELHKKEGLADD